MFLPPVWSSRIGNHSMRTARRSSRFLPITAVFGLWHDNVTHPKNYIRGKSNRWGGIVEVKALTVHLSLFTWPILPQSVCSVSAVRRGRPAVVCTFFSSSMTRLCRQSEMRKRLANSRWGSETESFDLHNWELDLPFNGLAFLKSCPTAICYHWVSNKSSWGSCWVSLCRWK